MLTHRELRNKVKRMREFGTVDLLIVKKQVKSSRKYSITQKFVLKTKVPYRVLDKAKSSSYWLHRFPFCEGIGRPGRKVK